MEKEEVASKLFGEDHKFIRYGVKGQDGGGVNMETIAAIPGSGGSWMTHIFFSAKDDKGAAELLDILKTGKLVARKKEGEEEKEGK